MVVIIVTMMMMMLLMMMMMMMMLMLMMTILGKQNILHLHQSILNQLHLAVVKSLKYSIKINLK